MNIIQRIKQDTKAILSNSGEFAVPVTFTSSGDSPVTETCNALAVRHALAVNPDTGLRARARSFTARVTVHEQALLDLSYPVRDSDGKIDLVNHLAEWTDISGTSKTYIITECFPNEVTGVIVCWLGAYDV